jgi:hypothetical protein
VDQDAKVPEDDTEPIATTATTTSESEEEGKFEPKVTPDTQESSPRPEETKEKAKNAARKSNDPLKWFGILVPPALRTAQSAFVNAVEGPIPQLVRLAREMRAQEIEIGRVRKQIKKL